MKKIKLTGMYADNKYALVDDRDYARCIKKSWHLSPEGRPRSSHKINGRWKLITIHRFILGFPNSHIDHKNRNPLDNRRSNLRLCTRAQNAANSPPKSKSGMKGVTKHHFKWATRIKVNQKDICVGLYKTKEEAAAAYNEAAKKYFGEFAWLNPV